MLISTFSLFTVIGVLSTLPPPNRAEEATILTPDNSMKDLVRHINASCEVKSQNKSRNARVNETATTVNPLTVFLDPCDHPRLRMFMHCNPKTKRCECYRDWKEAHVTDMYEKPEAWSDPNLSEVWFVYDHHAKECLIKMNKKCGTRSELTPYRCAGKGNCVRLNDEDNLSYLCAGGGTIAVMLLSWWKLIMWTSVIIIGFRTH